MDKEVLYSRLPTFAQNWACSVEGLRIQRSRYGQGFWEKLAWYEKNATLTEKELCAIRDARLISFLTHAYRTVPYYKRLFDSLGLRENDLDSVDVIKLLPILEKRQVQENPQDFMSVAVPPNQRIMAHTSGTTGAGLKFATTQEAQQEQWAVWWRYRRNHGINLGTWCGYFGGRSVVPLRNTSPPFWRVNRPGKQILFSAYHMNPRNMYAYVETLNKFRPEWLHGYPSTLGILAAFMNENGLKLDYPLKWVTTGAESLLEHQKTAILKAFGLNPIQHYGNAEAVANISQGRNGHLSVDEDFSFVEFLPTGDGVYKIIGTNFTNYATPFIRYDTKDNVTLEEKANIHGKARFISQIDGRIEDYIVLNDGTMLGRLDHIFKDMVRIREAQIVQNRPGQIEIKVVKGINYETGDENLLIKEIEKRCEEKICFTITYVENLLKTQSGKLRFVQRRLQ